MSVGLRVAAEVIQRALYWDVEDPYHYVRLQPEELAERPDRPGSSEILIVGGEDHKTGQEDDGELRFQRLEAWARPGWPQVGKWSSSGPVKLWRAEDYLAVQPTLLVAIVHSGMDLQRPNRVLAE